VLRDPDLLRRIQGFERIRHPLIVTVRRGASNRLTTSAGHQPSQRSPLRLETATRPVIARRCWSERLLHGWYIDLRRTAVFAGQRHLHRPITTCSHFSRRARTRRPTKRRRACGPGSHDRRHARGCPPSGQYARWCGPRTECIR
jgi:hypothetical protein